MGQSVLRIALERDDCEVCAALAPSQSTLIGEPLSQVYGKGAPDIEFTSQLDPDLLQFCGAGALSTDDRENYAVLMRIAMLSALEADDTTGNVGFRCARDARGAQP